MTIAHAHAPEPYGSHEGADAGAAGDSIPRPSGPGHGDGVVRPIGMRLPTVPGAWPVDEPANVRAIREAFDAAFALVDDAARDVGDLTDAALVGVDDVLMQTITRAQASPDRFFVETMLRRIPTKYGHPRFAEWLRARYRVAGADAYRYAHRTRDQAYPEPARPTPVADADDGSATDVSGDSATDEGAAGVPDLFSSADATNDPDAGGAEGRDGVASDAGGAGSDRAGSDGAETDDAGADGAGPDGTGPGDTRPVDAQPGDTGAGDTGVDDASDDEATGNGDTGNEDTANGEAPPPDPSDPLVRATRRVRPGSILRHARNAGLIGNRAYDAIASALRSIPPGTDAADSLLVEQRLVELALNLDPRQLDERIAEIIDTLDPEAGRRREESARANRFLAFGPTDRDGLTAITGRLDRPTAALLRTYLHSTAAPDTDAQLGLRTPGQRNHDALTLLLRHALRPAPGEQTRGRTDPDPSRDVDRTRRDQDARQPDVAESETFAAPTVSDLLGTQRGVPTQLVVFASLEQLLRGSGLLPLAQGGHIRIEDVLDELQSLHTSLLVTNEHGDPLRAGRSARIAGTLQRLVLLWRDRGCVIPACRAQAAHTEAHHIRAWASGGNTDVDNLALLCPKHHELIDQWELMPHGGRIWCRRRNDPAAAPQVNESARPATGPPPPHRRC